MTYPLPPEISTSYSAAEQALGDGTLPGQELDVDFAAVRASVTSAIEFLKGITRSDGKLANGIVTAESLASSVIAGFDAPTVWATGQDYTTSSLVFEGVKLYICTTAHTSGVFATDLASSRWSLLADLTPPGSALIAANNLSDLADVGNARANLGLGSMSTASSGTGGTQYRTNSQNEAVFQPILTGLTSSVAELNKLAGTPAGLTATEIGYLDGVTSAIQTQLDGKAATPQGPSGPGQWVLINPGVNTAYNLPAGGTWAYFIARYAVGGTYVFAQDAGTLAGGTQIGVAVASQANIGFAWRVM